MPRRKIRKTVWLTRNAFSERAIRLLLISALFFSPYSPPRTDAAETKATGGIDLVKRYSTTLIQGDTSAERARAWDFTAKDIYKITRFSLQIGTDLRVEIDAADLGIGHCKDGAVWAAVIPRGGGRLNSSANAKEETIAHLWLRFHPKEISTLFPPETVSSDGATNLWSQMRAIASHKMNGSWQAGNRALIPEPKDLTVDIDTTNGARRFFVVDNDAHNAKYIAAFESRPMKPAPVFKKEAAEAAFDQIWEVFDRKYAMFVLRPEVDWNKLRDQYRPKALAAKSTYEFAGVCAEMLKQLRDLHIWLRVAGAEVPVFNRERVSNANPAARAAILGKLEQTGRVAWAVTADKIGYIAIYGWNDQRIPGWCNEVLEQMRDTRGLIVDVRLNGGGSEDQAMEFAGRFLNKEFVYAFNQYRNGPKHTDFTEKFERKVKPVGPWRYERPVLLLIGQKCMSSNESFVAMMTGAPNVTTMGDHTCGSSGNPEMVNLPLDMTISVPKWIDFLPDGTPLDERGVQPQVLFKAQPGAFEGERDDLLTAAIERFRSVHLPEISR